MTESTRVVPFVKLAAMAAPAWLPGVKHLGVFHQLSQLAHGNCAENEK